MNFFRNLSLKHKQMLLMLAIATVALGLGYAGFLLRETALFRESLLETVSVRASVIGTVSTAALEFDDAKAAQEIMGALAADRNMLAGALYAKTGALLGSYRRADVSESSLPAHLSGEGRDAGAASLAVWKPVLSAGELVGCIYLKSDLGVLVAHRERLALTGLGVLFISLLVAAGLSSWLQRLISRPVLHLLATMKAVTEQKDFSQRAVKTSHDELGALADGFNDMLQQVQNRDGELQMSRDLLEKRVGQRTGELQFEVAERRRTEQEVKESHQFLQSTLDALSSHIAILDETGVILSVNAAWNRFAQANEHTLAGLSAGGNYLEVCDRARGECAEEAPAVARGIRAVMSGETGEFRLEYPCHSPQEQRWFIVRVTRFGSEGARRIVVAHENITERKQAEEQMAELSRQLIDTSRQAGMAEIATGVLHNVGNVLNSVNVSANLVSDQVRKTPVADLGRVVALLREQGANLGAFFTSDPRGPKVPDFLAQLSDRFTRQQESQLKEVAALQKNVEHIKDIVAMQQSYAKVSGLTESLSPVELIEDALRMNDGSFQKHEVELVRELPADLPRVSVDKHKVLQILVNLLRNAKHACDDSGRADKRITVRATHEADRILITVADNGLGIPAENLNRIFNHGFTTKKTGHGFGLHSAANAAQAMGGSLTVHSDGAGRGAVFTLELPRAREGIAA